MLKTEKTIYLFSLLIFVSIVDGEELGIKNNFDGIEQFKNHAKSTEALTLPTKKDFESGVAGLKRVLNLNQKPDKIPNNLVELDESFKSLKEKIKSDEQPDNVDIVFLIDANGKTQTIATMRFLGNIENELINFAKRKNPEINMKLASVVDAFVAAGSGAIPASVGAIGEMTQEEALSHVSQMPTKMIYPKSVGGIFGCCGCLGDTAESIVSAYFSTPIIVNKNSSDWDSLTYDSFDFSKSRGVSFLKIFGSNTIDDLKSSLEFIALSDSDSIAGLVCESISARDHDAKSRVKRLAVAETLSIAENALTISSKASQDTNFSEKAESAIEDINHINVWLKKSIGNKYGAISYLRDVLLRKTDIERDMVILNISTDTFPGKVLVPSFSYDVKLARNGKKIINLNYRFAIPSYLYKPKKNQEELFEKVVANGVKSVFFNKINGRKTNISMATGMLIDFLNECNDRVLEEINLL